jgi:hypothetical protein
MYAVYDELFKTKREHKMKSQRRHHLTQTGVKLIILRSKIYLVALVLVVVIHRLQGNACGGRLCENTPVSRQMLRVPSGLGLTTFCPNFAV